MSKQSRVSDPYGNDVSLFLICIPIISAINYHLTYSNIQLGWFLIVTFTIDTLQGYLAWWAVRTFIFYLDSKWPYEIGGSRRIAVQLIATLLIGLFIISSTTEIVSWIVKGEAAPIDFYYIDLIIISIWFLVINGIYIGLYYNHKWRVLQEKKLKEDDSGVGGLVVKQGKSDILLKFDELAGLFVDGEYVGACHRTGQRYLLSDSMDQLEKVLPSHHFFRLNRQYIIHRQLISGFKRGENGKLLVLINYEGDLPTNISVSRTKASAFKEWFRLEHVISKD